ncbi:MAG: hypothetical protein Q4B13_05365 [Lautropia sp.]|nr:hypothetical protein [Lautropia sp.]
MFVISYLSSIISDDAKLLGEITRMVAPTGIQSTRTAQINAWETQVLLLKNCANQLIAGHEAAKGWHLILEYELSRRQKRPDVILLAEDVILVIEFKVGAASYESLSRWQVEDYCSNLRDFHGGSAGHAIVPVLCATAAPSVDNPLVAAQSWVAPIRLANADDLAHVLLSAYVSQHSLHAISIYADAWINAPYRPTLSVIEAAERLYENHDVREISHSYASNLNATTDLLAAVIRDVRAFNRHYVCFVTGVLASCCVTGSRVWRIQRIRTLFVCGRHPAWY